eukprot:TRINITY_DN1983_c0_g1_i1.p1 TRINITY_DN1983_c0_g1~~TRINITY_DN1983_c0_g1_i1.p1  ORF type:complete len:169 (+),score=87.53 TRINITY_DN1983_c0_g1_i1:79-585(+)
MSLCRQNFSDEAEQGINAQIQMEQYASQMYLSMAAFFERDEVALPGFQGFFQKSAEEEREHASKLVAYLNKRGGRVKIGAIKEPKIEWGSALEALEDALALEKSVNESLLKLHAVASAKGDAQMCDYLEGEFLKEQVEGEKEIADMITRLKRVGEGLGVFMYNKLEFS